MSVKPTQVTDKIYDYLLEHSSAEDEFLSNLRKEADDLGIPPINISAEQGKFLQFYLKTLNPKNSIELGTLAGYSAIVMGRALSDDALLTTIEVNGKYARYAAQKVEEDGLSDKVKVINAHGIEYLEQLPDGTLFDFAFIDADKKNYPRYVELLHPYMRVGGVIAADNSLAFGFIVEDDSKRHDREDIHFIRDFNKYFFSREDYFTSLVTVGDGILMGIKLR